jgi:nucleosome binding factor SPN SPT16 subunit
MSLNWGNIMKTIMDDPGSFFEQGGWKIILEDSDVRFFAQKN